METARFMRAGGNIVVDVSCKPKRDGSYSILLWEAEENTVVSKFPGNFINADDDAYKLKKPNRTHDGRIVECLAVVSVPGGLGPATVKLRVSQDARTLAETQADVPPNSPGGLADLFILLTADGA